MIGEDDPGVLAPLSFNDLSGNPIENHNSLLTILCNCIGNNEYRVINLRYRNFPLPTETTDLTRSTTSIHGEERDTLQVCWQFPKETSLRYCQVN